MGVQQGQDRRQPCRVLGRYSQQHAHEARSYASLARRAGHTPCHAVATGDQRGPRTDRHCSCERARPHWLAGLSLLSQNPKHRSGQMNLSQQMLSPPGFSSGSTTQIMGIPSCSRVCLITQKHSLQSVWHVPRFAEATRLAATYSNSPMPLKAKPTAAHLVAPVDLLRVVTTWSM